MVDPMALDDKTTPFAYHSVIYIEVVPANTNRGQIRYVPVISQPGGGGGTPANFG